MAKVTRNDFATQFEKLAEQFDRSDRNLNVFDYTSGISPEKRAGMLLEVVARREWLTDPCPELRVCLEWMDNPDPRNDGFQVQVINGIVAMVPIPPGSAIKPQVTLSKEPVNFFWKFIALMAKSEPTLFSTDAAIRAALRSARPENRDAFLDSQRRQRANVAATVCRWLAARLREGNHAEDFGSEAVSKRKTQQDPMPIGGDMAGGENRSLHKPLTHTQFRILEALHSKGLTAENLAGEINKSVSATKKALAKLTKLGLVGNTPGLGYFSTKCPPPEPSGDPTKTL